MTTTSNLCRELREFLNDLVRCYTDTIDYIRTDVYRRMLEMKKELWRGYYTGAVWINEKTGCIEAGDVVVLLEDMNRMMEALKKFGCKLGYIHQHHEFGTAHIHIESCPIRGREREFAKLITT